MDEFALPIIHQKVGDNFIFQQDNASSHGSSIVLDFFAAQRVELLPWPAKSPDLNLIEHVWVIMKEFIYDNSLILNKNQLKNCIEEAANVIRRHHKETINKMYNNYFDRVMRLINGGDKLLK